MIRKSKLLLHNILESIESIGVILGNDIDFLSFRDDESKRQAVEREFESIGEAINRLSKMEPDIGIPGLERIIILRNKVLFARETVDNETIWSTIVQHLQLLKKEIMKKLSQDSMD